MRIADYIRASALDFVLCLIVACFTGLANCGAFFVSPDLQFNPIALAAFAALPLALLFAAAYSRRTVIPGAICVIVSLVVACLITHAVAGEGVLFKDSTSNPEIFVIIMYACACLTFLMTRKRWMARVFVLVVIIDICFVEFMYKEFYWYALIGALVAASALAIYRNYRTNLRVASTDSVSFASAFGVGMGYALLLAAVSSVLFFAFVVPLNPQAFEPKLFTRYMTYETIQMTGIGDASTAPGSASTTNQANDNTEMTDVPPEDEGTQDEERSGFTLPFELPTVATVLELAQGALQKLTDLYNFLLEEPIRIPFFLIAVAAVIASPFVLKKWLRARWYAKTCAMAPIACVERFYLFFLKRFAKIKVTKPDELTLREFAESCNSTLAGFAAEDGSTDFKALTDIYCKGVYGGIEPTSSEIESYKAFYGNFYKAFSQAIGRPRYALKFFTV